MVLLFFDIYRRIGPSRNQPPKYYDATLASFLVVGYSWLPFPLHSFDEVLCTYSFTCLR